MENILFLNQSYCPTGNNSTQEQTQAHRSLYN